MQSNKGALMDQIFPTPIHGILERETYSWDEMERRGWHYDGVKKERFETLELWRHRDSLAIVNLDGKILSIKHR
jgi:hypothetical protein